MQASLRLSTQEMDQSGPAAPALSSIHRRARNALNAVKNTSQTLKDITNATRHTFAKAHTGSIKRQRIRKALHKHVQQKEQLLLQTVHQVVDIDRKDESKYSLIHAESLKASEERYRLETTVEDVMGKHHAEMKPYMPDAICGWMFEICLEADLEMGTFILGAKLFQRYLALSHVRIAPDSLQLYGMLCLFLAFKFTESSDKLSFSYLANLAEDAWTVRELRVKEMEILAVLDYRLCAPTPLHFLERLTTAAAVHDPCNMVLDQASLFKSMLFYVHVIASGIQFFNHSPSLIASASVALGRAIHGLPVWNQTFLHYSGHSQADITAAVDQIISAVFNTLDNAALHCKFGHGVDFEPTRLAIAASNGALQVFQP